MCSSMGYVLKHSSFFIIMIFCILYKFIMAKEEDEGNGIVQTESSISPIPVVKAAIQVLLLL